MNKLITLGMVSVVTLGISVLTITCPVNLTNDTDKMVHVITNDTELPELYLNPGQEGRFGNHAHHVEFTVEKQDASGKYFPVVKAKQLACAKRLVLVTVTSLMNHRYSDGTQIHPAKFEIIRLDKADSASIDEVDDQSDNADL